MSGNAVASNNPGLGVEVDRVYDSKREVCRALAWCTLRSLHLTSLGLYTDPPKGNYAMLLLSTILPVLTLAKLVTAKDGDSFRESLTLHPLPDGRLSVLFDFVTEFTSTPSCRSSCPS